jgi:cell division protein FtsZ
MIELPRNNPTQSTTDPVIKILGIGGAGANALDRLLLDGVPGADLVAVNTDAQSLIASVASDKVQIGRATTRGLGTGGDPELGYIAAEEAADELRSAVEGASMVFLLVGLGGGTGSGAAPLIANYARENNALVVVFATLPFQFEGRRRMAQAEEALAALQQQADVVICFENDRMADAVNPRAGIQEAFGAADQTISQSVRAIAALINQRGFVHIGFDELATVLRGQNARCIFGFGEADGDNRAHEALGRALKNPLMDRGRLLDDTANVLVNVVGGTNMTLNEVQILMEELGRHIGDSTRVLFGCATDAALGGKMRVTILSALGVEARTRFAAPPAPVARVAPSRPTEIEPETSTPSPIIAFVDRDEDLSRPAVAKARPEPVIAAVNAPAAPLAAPGSTAVPQSIARKAAADAEKAAREAKQEQMQFEPVTRGRFEKSEPTIVNGEDLDVPTFLRRNLKMK